MSGKFVAEFVNVVTPACDTCKHWSPVLPGICTAFPEGIPTDILLGKNNHVTHVEGDHGILYEAVDVK